MLCFVVACIGATSFNTALKTLKIHHNRISDAGAVALAGALRVRQRWATALLVVWLRRLVGVHITDDIIAVDLMWRSFEPKPVFERF
jgi:hypothetical protein